MHFVRADGIVARPLAVIQAVAQGKRPFMKCGPDGQAKSSDVKTAALALDYTKTSPLMARIELIEAD